ncbi:MAG: HD domain-containing phosphohydrolase [Deinococcota bacterium]
MSSSHNPLPEPHAPTVTQLGDVLVVDDTELNLRMISQVLRKEGYQTRAVNSGEAALQTVREALPEVILLDITMPDIDGYEVCQMLKAQPSTADIPVIFISALDAVIDKVKAFQVGAADYIPKPIQVQELLARVRHQIDLRRLQQQLRSQNELLESRNRQLRHEIRKRHAVEAEIRKLNTSLEGKVRARTQALERVQLEILERLSLAGERRDDDTGQHTLRVGYVSSLITQALGQSSQAVELIRMAARLHDVGKIGIPDKVLLKPGKLTGEEYDLMKQHTTIGAEMLAGSQSPLIRLAEEIALSHHERWDGGGYPRGLSGQKIPLSGRIVAVADVFDALTHERPYKRAWSLDKVFKELKQARSSQFDPRVVDAFLKVAKSGKLEVLNSPDKLLR